MQTLLVLSIVLCAAIAAPSKDKEKTPACFNICPGGWFNHGPRCYIFINTAMTWYNAKEHCHGLGASLASVSNHEQYKFLQGITLKGGQSIAWLGGFKLQGRWMWIDQKGFYYANWYSQVSSASYPCMYLRGNHGWGNHPCTSSFGFICSKDPFGC